MCVCVCVWVCLIHNNVLFQHIVPCKYTTVVLGANLGGDEIFRTRSDIP
jgi:hypothetical protein